MGGRERAEEQRRRSESWCLEVKSRDEMAGRDLFESRASREAETG
jgi:hypothetical protein